MANRRKVLAAVLLSACAVAWTTGSAFAAASKCDAKITKAAGKKAACKANVYSKAYAKDIVPDAAALTKCETKFDDACTKAKDEADCVTQSETCAVVEDAVDTCVADIVSNSCVLVSGVCWYLGASGQSCTTACAAEGLVYNAASETYAGSSGTDANCEALLDTLGAPGTGLTFPSFSCSDAVGCGVAVDNSRARCAMPATTAGATIAGVQRACACQ